MAEQKEHPEAQDPALENEQQSTEQPDLETPLDTSEKEEENIESEALEPDTIESVAEKAKQELGEMKEKYLRLYADFENFRRRSAKEKLDFSKYASESLMLEILPVLDNFDRARKALKTDNQEVADAVGGVLMLSDGLLKALQAKGLKELEVKAGDALDTDKHEAITQIPAPDDSLKGKIVDVIEKGYQLNDKVIRYAKVVVGAQ